MCHFSFRGDSGLCVCVGGGGGGGGGGGAWSCYKKVSGA